MARIEENFDDKVLLLSPAMQRSALLFERSDDAFVVQLNY